MVSNLDVYEGWAKSSNNFEEPSIFDFCFFFPFFFWLFFFGRGNVWDTRAPASSPTISITHQIGLMAIATSRIIDATNIRAVLHENHFIAR
jgi:hypothetical protein